MQAYKDLNQDIIDNGIYSPNRTGVSTYSVFGREMRFNLKEGFPALTLKRAFFRGAVHEWYWMTILGSTNVTYLQENNIQFWNQWALEEDVYDEVPMSDHERASRYAEDSGMSLQSVISELNKLHIVDGHKLLDERGVPRTKKVLRFKKGELGPIYGEMMRRFPGHDGSKCDQIAELVNNLKNNPKTRRHVVSLWCPSLLPDESMSPQDNVIAGRQALAPCHWMFEIKCDLLNEQERRKLLIEHLIGNNIHEDRIIVGQEGFLSFSGCSEGDVLKEYNIPERRLNLHFHMRSNDAPAGLPVNLMFYGIMATTLAKQTNMDIGELWYTGTDVHIYENQINETMELLGREPGKLPTLWVNPDVTDFFDYKPEDFKLIGYEPQAAIKVKVAV